MLENSEKNAKKKDFWMNKSYKLLISINWSPLIEFYMKSNTQHNWHIKLLNSFLLIYSTIIIDSELLKKINWSLNLFWMGNIILLTYSYSEIKLWKLSRRLSIHCKNMQNILSQNKNSLKNLSKILNLTKLELFLFDHKEIVMSKCRM